MSDSYKAWCESQYCPGPTTKRQPSQLERLQDEVGLLRAEMTRFHDDMALLWCMLPPVETLSGWDDPGCPPDIARRLNRVARIQDVPVPPHLIEAAAREDE